MAKWTKFSHRPRSRSNQELIRAIAEQCAAELEPRLPPDLSRMELSELRGYIHARASSVVRRHVHAAATEFGFQDTWTATLLDQALERTVDLVVRRTLPPAPQLTWRAAA